MLVAGKKSLIETPFQEFFPFEVHASNAESSNQNSITEGEPCGVNEFHGQELLGPQQLLERRKSSLLTTC